MTELFLLGLVTAAALAGLVIVIRRWRALVHELEDTASWIHRMELGRLEQRLPPSQFRPIHRIATAVNELIRRLNTQVSELSTSRSELVAIMNNMTEGVLQLDRTGRILLANPAFSRLLAASTAPPLKGALIHEIARLPALLEILQEAARGPRTGEIELTGPPPRTLMVRAAPMDGGPEPGCVLAVLDDVTDFKRIDTIRRDFVANASHELKTPLAAIQGYAEMLLDETGSEDARIILHHTQRLGKLVQDLLTLSRLEARNMDLKPKPVAIKPSVDRAVLSILPQAEAKGISIQQQIPGSMEAVADEEALLQIMSNLLDNAVKYTPRGGQVTVLAHTDHPDRITVAVRDSGPGIPTQHLPRLFERFYRVDKARSRELGGTGLGLAIVKHLAELMGGEAYIHSPSGHGTEAGVRLRVTAPS